MHRDIKADIQKQIKSDALEIQKAPDLWRHEFNTVRPHEKLGMKCPGDVYQKSKKVYTSEKTEIGYPLFYRVRKLSRSGCLKLDRNSIYISTALAGETIGITDLDESFFSIYFD